MSGDEFKSIRERMGLSQMQMAVKADVSIGTIQALESDELNPTARTRGKIASAYGVSPNDIERSDRAIRGAA